ncbi:hypothetical protein COF68_05985 [Bacillus toyonensis]|uniref:hypothetical protein n=1 Tax=Bacillus toyonensis TaxID=155322 RepID=UPI000BFB5A26|nr:hypothetical protein [Bacillus toyonensis]PHE64385.1 hypothetical protein COF68_05985 [Bacillus toyonensis]
MNIVELLTKEKLEGLFRITESSVPAWVGADVRVDYGTTDSGDKFRYIYVASVEHSGLDPEQHLNQPVSLVGAITTAEFKKL